ncbi:X-ray repair cross-complementing protein 6 isoform X2 [Aplysia californica]|uniref:X-ray repair cross-complementing protein 6 isoform X2 n=1 Tax=Aplysia californica TaxID=6500 RepID=A0ABM1VRY4_APLCA|nr:X-ray repair cross-complementing protein 6 isoform X2 [Aplysia californica]
MKVSKRSSYIHSLLIQSKLRSSGLAMADWGFAHFGDDDENEDEDGEFGFQARFNQRDGLIFLIDTSKSMFDAADDEECLFQLCMKAAKTTVQNKIISSERDLIGTVFFGTEESENQSGFKHVYVYQSLDQPGAQRILDLEDMEENCVRTFSKDYGHNEAYSLRDALWTCQNMFASSAQNLGSKRIMLFTNNDDPHGANPQLRRLAVTKASDLNETGIDLELMHLQNPGQSFDINKFYKDILYNDDDDINEMADPAEKMEELLRRVRSKDHKKRANRRIPFSLGEGLNFSVGVYNLVRSCPKPYAVKLTKKENAELKSHTKTYLPDTGEVLMPQDLKKAQTYGGRKICFENDEVTEIKRFDTPGFTLMGFKPRSSLKKYFHVKPAQFIYPDEMKVTGSTQAFSALLKKCLERDVTPICKYIPSRNLPPKFVTLLPQAEELDEHKVQVTPPGFHVIFLPCADDFRRVNYVEKPRATADQIDKAKEVIKKLKFKFSSEDFENPVLQNHWRNIEALALERDEVEEPVDHILPSVELFAERAGKALDEFKDMVFPPGYVPGQKRRAPAASTAAKKAKAEDALAGLDVKKEAEAGRLGKLTVAVLRDVIKKEKINTTATRKNDLIDAINDHFGI